ncbi:hypothetical protein BUALT_Bualt19G0077900 [Buddleja alternifolia]|uniref:Uncharacterized protein n=1 Tax=Buddleja alternifolia TaxID=168488 RepID=A0AAV6W0B8_9LAMI|nr:hypothetical protein BUALT_Bualt19G0077900 [Buddleja alternifolia]
MGSNYRQKKSSGSSFSLCSCFTGRNSGYDTRDYDEYAKAYRVYPGDQDRGRWVAEPGIDKKASAYISLTTDKWGAVAN